MRVRRAGKVQSSRECTAARPTTTPLQRGCRKPGSSWEHANRGAATRHACGSRPTSVFGRARVWGASAMDAELLPLCAPRSLSATRVLSAVTV